MPPHLPVYSNPTNKKLVLQLETKEGKQRLLSISSLKNV